MFKLRKAQGLSMNVIIVAVLALLVLVIISVIFTSKMRSTRQSIDACENNGGECVNKDIASDSEYEGIHNDYCGGYDSITTQYECKNKETEVCCIRR